MGQEGAVRTESWVHCVVAEILASRNQRSHASFLVGAHAGQGPLGQQLYLEVLALVSHTEGLCGHVLSRCSAGPGPALPLGTQDIWL